MTNLYGNYNQKTTSAHQILYDYLDYAFNQYDQKSLKLLRDKYYFNHDKLVNSRSPWQNKGSHDFRRQFVDLLKDIAAAKVNSDQFPKSDQQIDHTGIVNLLEDYFELLIDNKFQEAENNIKKHQFIQYPRILKKLNAFSLKMLKYEAAVEENIKNKHLSEELDFYRKVIQNMHQPKILLNLITTHQKKLSPYMPQPLSKKLVKQVFLAQQKQEYERICKGYEKIIFSLNKELKKPVLQFKYTNSELSSFSSTDYKSEFTEQSAIKLRKSLADLIYNISSTKEKQIIYEFQKPQSINTDKQTWTYYLLDHFLTILSNNFEQKHFNTLQAFVNEKMFTNKSIKDSLSNLKGTISRLSELKQFEKALEGLSINIPSNIQSIMLMIKPKEYNTQKMIKLFKRELIYRLMNEVHSNKIVSANQTFLETTLSTYRQWIDQDIAKSLEKLVLKTRKERKCLEDLRMKLSEILKLIGIDELVSINTNPNTIDFYTQVHTIIQKICQKLQRKNDFREQIKTIKPLSKDSYGINLYQHNQNNSQKQIKNNDNLIILEQNLNSQLEKCQKLKNKLLDVFGNFEKQILKNIVTTYTVRGGYEITRQSFDYYVKKKNEQINKVYKEYDPTKKSQVPTNETILKKGKTTEQIQTPKHKVLIDGRQLNIIQLQQQYEKLHAELMTATIQYSQQENSRAIQIDNLKKELQSKNLLIQKMTNQASTFQTGNRRHEQSIQSVMNSTRQSLPKITSSNSSEYNKLYPGQINIYGQSYQYDPSKNNNPKEHSQRDQTPHTQKYSFKTSNTNTIESLNQKIQQLEKYNLQLYQTVQCRNRDILLLQGSQTQAQKTHQSQLAQIQALINERQTIMKGKKQVNNQLNALRQSHHALIQDNNSKIQQLHDKLSALQQIQANYNKLRQEISQMKASQQQKEKQRQKNGRQNQSMEAIWRQQQKNNSSTQSISKELGDQKQKFTSLKYEINKKNGQIQVLNFRIKTYEQNLQKQQDQIKILKEQLQMKSSNPFKKQEETDKKKTTAGFRSLKEPDQNPRYGSRSISRQKPQLNALTNRHTTNNTAKIEQNLISVIKHEQTLKEKSKQLQQQYQKQLAEKLQSQRLQLANEKQLLEQSITKLTEDLNVVNDKLKQLIDEKKVQMQRTHRLQQQKAKVDKQAMQLKQQKEKIEEELFDLKQSVARLSEQDNIKKQQQDKQSKAENDTRQMLNNQLTQTSNQISQLKVQITALQQSIQTQKLKISQLQSVLQHSNQQKATYLQQKQQAQQLANQHQQQLTRLQTNIQFLQQTISQLQANSLTTHQTQSKPSTNANKSSQQQISQLEWKIKVLTNDLKLKQEECDELAGFQNKKPKPKRTHSSTQTHSLDAFDENKGDQKEENKGDQKEQNKGDQKEVKTNEKTTEKTNENTEDKIENMNQGSCEVVLATQGEQSSVIINENSLPLEREQISNNTTNPIPQHPTILSQQFKTIQNHIPHSKLASQQVQTQTQPHEPMLSAHQKQIQQQSTFLLTQNELQPLDHLQAISPSSAITLKSQVEGKEQQGYINEIKGDNAQLKEDVSRLAGELQNMKRECGNVKDKLKLTYSQLDNSSTLNHQLTISNQAISAQLQQLKQSSQSSAQKQTILKEQIQNNNSTINDLHQQIATLNAQIHSLNTQIITFKAQIHSLTSQITNYTSRIHSLTQQTTTLTRQLSQANETIGELTRKQQQCEQNIKVIKQQCVNKQLLLKKAQDHIAELQKQKQNYAPDMDDLRRQIKDYEITIRELRNTIDNELKPKINQLNAKEKTYKQQNERVKKQSLESIKQAQLHYATQLRQANKQRSNLELQIRQLKLNPSGNTSSASTYLQLQNDKLKKENQKQQAQLNNCYKESSQLNHKVKQLERKLDQKQSELQDMYHNLNATELSLKQLKQTSSSSTPNPNTQQKPISKYIMFDRLFPGEILEDEYQKKYLISHTIEKRLHAKITKTRLIYKHDPMNPTSFHNYIDNKQNFLIVIRTLSNKIFGAFTTEKFQPKSKESQFSESFIFSFNPESKEPISCFNLIKNMEKAKSVTYDEVFLIVGNSEIRWKQGERSVYSNFGIVNSYFDPKGTNVEALLQMGEEREAYIKGFECYQVMFQ